MKQSNVSQFLYLAVVSSVLHGQDQLRGIGGQQVPVLRLVPLLPVQDLERRDRGIVTVTTKYRK